MILMIDNYDSFTYNLVQYLGELGAEVETVRNDAVSVGRYRADETGRHRDFTGTLHTQRGRYLPRPGARHSVRLIPILGVCLGHQCIGQAFGAKVVRAERIMHGKTSMIYHRSQGVFTDLPQPFEATRYHSLVLQPDSIPECLSVMAWTEYQGGHEIMGMKHNAVRHPGRAVSPGVDSDRPRSRPAEEFPAVHQSAFLTG